MGDIEYANINAHVEVVRSHGAAHEYPWHFHTEHWTFGKIDAGEVCLETGRGKKILAKDETFRVAPLVPHKLYVAEGGSLTVVCIASSAAPSFNNIFAALQKEFAWDFSRTTVDASPRYIPGERPEAIEAVTRRIMEAPENPYPLEEMAALSGYSLWHFLRLFRKITGMTPHAFQRICRLRLAREHIRSGMAAAEAAAASGFTDQSHLYKVFKLHHAGLTPNLFAEACVTRPY